MSTKNISSLRIGIIGFGQHAQHVFLPALQSAPTISLEAIATSKATSIITAATGLIPTAVHSCYQQILERKDLDAIYIALPNHLHAEWTINCLNAGFHVLCEKPISLSLQQEQKISEASRINSKIVVEGFSYRYHPQHQIIRDLIRSGEIGEAIEIKGRYSYFLDDLSNIRLKADCAGGALNDVGCYLLDICRFLFDTEISVIAASAIFHNKIDIITSINLLLSNGVSAKLLCGCQSERSNFYEVYGSKGKIRACDAFHVPRNKAPRIEVSLRNKPTTAISAVKFNQTLGLIEYFCSAANDSIATTFGITSNGYALETIQSLSNKDALIC